VSLVTITGTRDSKVGYKGPLEYFCIDQPELLSRSMPYKLLSSPLSLSPNRYNEVGDDIMPSQQITLVVIAFYIIL
jgi:hypothetical protein